MIQPPANCSRDRSTFPKEMAGTTGRAPKILVVKLARDRLLAKLLPALFVILMCGSFMVGCAMRLDPNHTPAPMSGRVQERLEEIPILDAGSAGEKATPRVVDISGEPRAIAPAMPNDIAHGVNDVAQPGAIGGMERNPNRKDEAKSKPLIGAHTFTIRGGSWGIEGDELVQTSLERVRSSSWAIPGGRITIWNSRRSRSREPMGSRH